MSIKSDVRICQIISLALGGCMNGEINSVFPYISLSDMAQWMLFKILAT
ncbi:948_t:CDS:2 [Funneliformis mosseae]|uniref:948_t:CDS:1 n=1 Tax=Funneliformis mosseae TaxID=27381 RepID=A0A9N9D2G4_FUNMO|nr:948_t:CDS:2 [Funneliformis mosseae]